MRKKKWRILRGKEDGRKGVGRRKVNKDKGDENNALAIFFIFLI